MKVRLLNNKTGQVEEVEPSEVTRAVGSREYSIRKNVTIPVINPDTGELLDLPSEKAGEAFRGGFLYATPEFLAQHSQDSLLKEKQRIKEEEMGGIAGVVASTAQGIARGATFGLSDVAQTIAQGDEGKEYLQSLEEVNPTASTIGQISGAVATGLSGVGRAIAGRAAVAGAEAGTAAKALAPVGKTIAEKIAKTATAGALEGAVYGIGEGVSAAALGNPNEIAENILSGMGTGMLWGGAVGALLPVAGAAASGVAKGLGATERALLKRIKPKGPAGEAYSSLVDDPLARAGMKEAGGLEAFDEAGKKANEVTSTAQKQVNDFNTGIKKLFEMAENDSADLNKALKKMSLSEKQLVLETIEAQKSQWADRLMTEINKISDTPTQRATYNEMKQAVLNKAKAQGMLEDAEEIFTKLEKSFENPTTGKERIYPNFSEKQNAMAIWEAKKALSKPSKFTSASPSDTAKMYRNLRETADSFLKGDKADETTKELFKKQDPIFVALAKLDKVSSSISGSRAYRFNKAVSELAGVAPDSPVFGSLGKYQKIKNAILDNETARGQVKEIARNLFQTIDEPSVEALVSGMEQLVEIQGTRGGELFKKTLEKLRLNQGAAAKVKPIFEDAALSPLDKAIRIQKELGLPVSSNTMEKVAKYQKDFEKLAMVREASKVDVISDNLVTGLAGTAGWGVAGPVGGAIAGAGARSLTTPIRRLEVLTKLESLQNKGAVVVNKAADWLVGKTGRIAGSAAILDRDPIEPMKIAKRDYQKVYDTYSVYANPMQAAEIASNISEEYGYSPEVQQALTDHVIRLGQFANKVLPAPTIVQTVTGPRIIPPARDAIRAAMRKIQVYENPSWLLESIGNGYIPTQDEVDALSEGYPVIYSKLKSALEDRLLENPDTIKLSSTERVKLSRLFRLNNEETQSPEMAQFIQGSVYTGANKEPEIKQPNSAKLKMIQGMETETSRVTFGSIDD